MRKVVTRSSGMYYGFFQHGRKDSEADKFHMLALETLYGIREYCFLSRNTYSYRETQRMEYKVKIMFVHLRTVFPPFPFPPEETITWLVSTNFVLTNNMWGAGQLLKNTFNIISSMESTAEIVLKCNLFLEKMHCSLGVSTFLKFHGQLRLWF